MKLGACPKLTLSPEGRVWFRAIDPKYGPSPLSSAHTAAAPSRFSAGPLALNPFEVLYFAENAMTALWEVGSLFGSLKHNILVPNPSCAWLTINMHVQLQQVADLTQVSQQKLLGTTVQELTGDWEGYSFRSPVTSVSQPTGTAPTQDLGEALQSLPGIEGFRTVSAKIPYQMNLVVFPQKLLKGSQIVYHDKASGKTHKVTQ
jgi:RES domain-containing protein